MAPWRNFINRVLSVTFLYPNKKVTKEIVIGEALMPCSRTTNAPSPMYLSRAQRKNCITLSRRDGTSSQSCSWRRLRSRRPAVLVSTTGDGAGGFLRGTRVERELGLAPLSRFLLVLFLPKQEKYGTVTNSEYKKSALWRGGLSHYRTKLMDKVVDQLSPGSRMAAAGFSSHLRLPPSGEGKLCQGSMHTNLGMPGLLHSRQ